MIFFFCALIVIVQMNSKLKGSAFVFLGACSFGILSTIVKTAYSHGFELGDVTGSQTFFGMSILWLFYLIGRLKKKKQCDDSETIVSKKKSPAWKILVAGIFTGLVGIFYYKCVSLIPASVAIILLMQNVWISILIERLVFKKSPSKIQVLAMVIVLAGTVLAAGLFEGHIQIEPMGFVYGLLAALSYSIFIITSGRVGNDYAVVHKSALMITGACAITFILFPPITLFSKIFCGGLFPWGFALAVFGTVIPPFLFSKGVPMTGVSLGSILGAAELPVAVIASSIVLSEYVSPLQIVGVLAILSAIIISNLPRYNKH